MVVDEPIYSDDPAPEADEYECAGSSLDDLADAGLGAQDLDGIDSAFESTEGQLREALGVLDPCSFLAPGGDWGGSRAPIERAIAIGARNGLRVTSRKRSWGSRGSDHHIAQRSSYAADMSNGSSPTPQMDRTAKQIAAALGRDFDGGYLTVSCSRHGVRLQLIWRAPDHYDHVHVGARRV